MEREQRGSELSKEDQVYVKAAYVYRNVKGRAMPPLQSSFPVQFENDEEWLENTYFHVTKSGRLDGRYRHCTSYPYGKGREK